MAEKECFGRCPRCGSEHGGRNDWNYDEYNGGHWFYEYYTCHECNTSFTEMYRYVGTFYEEQEVQA